MTGRPRARSVFLVATGAVAWLGVLLQFYLTMANSTDRGVTIVRFLSYFTILANLLVALALSLPRIIPTSSTARFLSRTRVQAGIAVDIALVAIGYNVLLRHIWAPKGLGRVADEILHVVTPLLFVSSWLLFLRKGDLQWSDALRWLVFPLAYLVYTFVHGALSHFYPYYFLDVEQLGYVRTGVAVTGLTVGLLLISLLTVAIDRALGNHKANR